LLKNSCLVLFSYLIFTSDIIIVARNAPDIRPDNPTFLDIRPDTGFDLPDIRPDTGNSRISGLYQISGIRFLDFFAGYPAKSVSGASLIVTMSNGSGKITNFANKQG
jgi:hypothetical protein